MSIRDMFQDKVYEDMDDISKMVEPIESTVNQDLAKFPDEVEITEEDILNLYTPKWGWGSLSLRNIVDPIAKELNLKSFDSDQPWGLVEKFFRFETRDIDKHEMIIINFKTGAMNAKLFLVKHSNGYTEKELEAMCRHNLVTLVLNTLSNNRVVDKPRMNELADLFGADEVKSDRTFKGKVLKFCKHIHSLVDDKKLDIRDLDLATKFATWVVLYVRDGNLAALNNITRIKIMMHDERPIYSIEERSVT